MTRYSPIARAHRTTWSVQRETILAVFNDIRPALESYRRQREGGEISALKTALASAKAGKRLRDAKNDHTPTPIQSSPRILQGLRGL